MAIILCGYCISSIRTARRDAQVQPPLGSNSKQRLSQAEHKDGSWIQQALLESQAEKDGKSGKHNK